MAKQCVISNAAAIAACNAIVDLLDAGTPPGKIKIYANDQAVPADADASTTATLLCTIDLDSTAAFGAAADGVGKATAAADCTPALSGTAIATGVAAFFRACNSTGTNIIQGTVGTANTDMVLNSVAISSGAVVTITNWTFSLPEQV